MAAELHQFPLERSLSNPHQMKVAGLEQKLLAGAGAGGAGLVPVLELARPRAP